MRGQQTMTKRDLFAIAVVMLGISGRLQAAVAAEDTTLQPGKEPEVLYSRLEEFVATPLMVDGVSYPVYIDRGLSHMGTGANPANVTVVVAASRSRIMRITYLAFPDPGSAYVFMHSRQRGTLTMQVPDGWTTRVSKLDTRDPRFAAPMYCFFTRASLQLVSALCAYHRPDSAFVVICRSEENLQSSEPADYTGSGETKQVASNFALAAGRTLTAFIDAERADSKSIPR
jgi:hypothetical protein